MSPTWTVRWTESARRDHARIIRWTAGHFGSRQAKMYTETIALAVAALRDGPDILGSTPRNDLGAGIRTLHVARHGRKGRHFIVINVSGDHTLDVLRLLHDSMELTNHVPS